MNALARLVRLPALPTAMADVLLGALVTGALLTAAGWAKFLVLLVGSAFLYMSGMVLNDYFDEEDDRKHRPDRPIPAGEISSRTALFIGLGLMVAGVVLASLVASPVLACLLAVAIFAYDAVLKQTPLGPISMGLCRALHVLLACSLGGFMWKQPGVHLALTVGVYVIGVTWFARNEEKRSTKAELGGAAAVLVAALVLGLAVPVFCPENTASPLFPYLLVALGFLLGASVWRAINDPQPLQVQAGVKQLLIGLILLDAVLASGAAGTLGLVVLVLALPALLLARMSRLSAT
jgi:4-hydroxybenzoate polyprenyltransferase